MFVGEQAGGHDTKRSADSMALPRPASPLRGPLFVVLGLALAAGAATQPASLPVGAPGHIPSASPAQDAKPATHCRVPGYV